MQVQEMEELIWNKFKTKVKKQWLKEQNYSQIN